MDLPAKVQLSGWPPDHARQRGRMLAPTLRGSLTHRFRAHLVGSWATGEAHLPRPSGGRIHSLSDVDVVIDEPPTAEKSAAIARSVLSLALQHGVEVSKVSVRCRSEIDAFWNPSRVGDFENNRLEAGRFLTFWALIGVAEALSSSRANSVVDGRAYVLVKFFFKLCRNVLLIKRRNPASYRELTATVLGHLNSHPAVNRAYAIKTGCEITMSTTDCEALLSESIWAALTIRMVDEKSGNLLANLRNDIRMWYQDGTSLDVETYIGRIRTFEESPELLPARIKAIHDHEQRRAGSTP